MMMYFLFLVAIIFTAMKGTDSVCGVVFTRWGAGDCRGASRTAILLSSGIAAGTGDTHSGGASSLLCLPKEPSYDSTTKLPRSSLSHLFAAEYTHPQEMFGSRQDGDKIPCALCLNTANVVVHVFPAQSKCPDGWVEEYGGYMTAGLYNKGRSSPICVDKGGYPLADSSSNTDTYTPNPSMVLLSAKCGDKIGLSCEQYKQDVPIACVVCTAKPAEEPEYIYR